MAQNTQSYNTVVGYFSSDEQADRALQALTDAGFNRSQIGIAGRSWDETTKRSSTTGTGTHTSFWQKVKNFFEGTEERQREATDDDGYD